MPPTLSPRTRAPRQPPPPVPHDREFRTDIEGLRAIAVLLVVAYHAGVPGTQGGFVGVDVFFVLSGYLITGILVREIETRGTLSLRSFYARRARRLLPASALMVVATIVAGMFVFAPVEQEGLARTALSTAVYLSNVWFARSASDYFAAAAELNPLLHTWSLAVEEQFYLAWPVLVLLTLRGRRTRRVLVGAILSVAVLSFAGSVWLTQVRQPWAFFGSPTRAWEFGIGGAAALIPAGFLAARRGRILALLGWAGVAAILLAALTFSKAMPFPGTAALIPVLGTAAALVAGAGAPGSGVGRVLDTPPLQRLGQLSYGWYLWHWPALVFAAALIPGISGGSRALAALGALGVAAATYRWFENPIRHHRMLVRHAGRSLALAVGIAAVTAGASRLWLGYAGWAGNQPAQRLYTSAYRQLPRVYADGCNPVPSQPEVRECVYGDTTSQATLVLFGDSHAAQWFPALEALALQRRMRLVTLLRSACPATDVTVFNSTLGRDFPECDRWRHEALDRIQALRPSAVVVASSMGYIRGAGGDQSAARLSLAQWEEGWRRTLTALDAAGVRTALLRDTPRPDFSVPTCLARAAMAVRRWGGRDDCAPERAAILPEGVFHAEQGAARGLPNVRVVDLSDRFCDAFVCDPVRGGIVVYRDGEHVTPAYSAALAPVLGERIGL